MAAKKIDCVAFTKRDLLADEMDNREEQVRHSIRNGGLMVNGKFTMPDTSILDAYNLCENVLRVKLRPTPKRQRFAAERPDGLIPGGEDKPKQWSKAKQGLFISKTVAQMAKYATAGLDLYSGEAIDSSEYVECEDDGQD